MGKFTSLQRNVWLLWIQTFLNGLIFYQPILSLYLQGEVEDFILIATIFAVNSIAIILLEVPSGAIADLFGRKKSLIVAAILQFCAITLLWIGQSLGILVGYALVGALAQSMMSGTSEALLYDSLGGVPANDASQSGSDVNAEPKPKLNTLSFKQAIAIDGVLWPLAASLAALLGGVLSQHTYRLPVGAALIPLGLRVLFTFFLQEPHAPSIDNQQSPSPPSAEKNSILAHMGSSLRNISRDKQLLLLFISGLLAYAFAEVAFQFKGIYLAEISLPLQYFGIISTISFGCSFLGSLFADKISRRWDDRTILIVCQIMLGVFLIGCTFIPNPLLNAIFLSLESFFWGLRLPIQSDWINARIDSSQRATINSVTSMANQLGFALVSPFMGYFMGILSMLWIFRILGLVQIFTVIFLLALQDRGSSDAELSME